MGSMSRCSLIILALAVIVLIDQCTYASYINTDNQGRSSPRDVQELGLFRRTRSACIERRGDCAQSPKGCCYPAVCRCSLWGADCRCAHAVYYP